MKAEDLMVGDYLRVAKEGICIKKDSIVQIRSVIADEKLESKNLVGYANCRPIDETQFDGGVWCDYLEPIPLTPEILSKNDWVNDGIYATLFYTTDIAVEFYFHEGVLRIYFNNELTYQSLPGINYVHTLQHHLRLCGINLEINI